MNPRAQFSRFAGAATAAAGGLALLGFARGADPLFLATAVVTLAAVALWCVTALDRGERQLRETLETYRSAFEDTNVAMVLTSLDNRFVRVNAAFANLFGYAETEMIGMTMEDVTHPDDVAESHARRQELLAGNAAFFQMQKRYRHRNGHVLWGLVNVALLRDSAGRPVSYAGQIQDVTQRKQAEEELRAAREELETRVRRRTADLEATNKELEAFSYSVSHDLRAPLRAIDGFARILEKEHAVALPAEGRELLRDVRANAERMAKLIDDLLRFSRLSRQPLRRQPVNCGEMVRQCVEELRRDWNGRRVDVRLGELPTCRADPALLKQVWLNLLGNAVKYTGSCPEAVVEVGSRPGQDPAALVYFVKDNGVGFDMRFARKLFGVFQRLHRAEEYEGTGVGLAIVHRIIRRHGGEVWAEAEPGRGATFSFTLGRGSSHDGCRPRPVSAGVPSSRMTE
jgi:PAS domain S-box-containing protein